MMKKLLHISLPVLFSLCTVFAYADRDSEVHNFQSLSSTGKIVYKNDNKTGVTDLLTYTCTGSEFGEDFFSSSLKKISINFGSKNAMVTTTAVDSVERVMVNYLYDSDPKKRPSIELRLSRDSVHWTEPIEPTSSGLGNYEFNFVPGRYFIRLTNMNSNKASITSLRYYFGWCNCFLYIPE